MASKRTADEAADDERDDGGAGGDERGDDVTGAPGGGQLVHTDGGAGMAVAKRPKTAEENAIMQYVQQHGITRTSGLQAPIMRLSGHEGIVYSAKFSPSGEQLASSSYDRNIFLWSTYGDCVNYNVLKGHQAAVQQVTWSWDGGLIFSASVDKFGAVWDAETGTRLKKLRGHTSFVNSISRTSHGAHIVATGGDDGQIKLHDVRVCKAINTFKHQYQVTSVCFSESGDQVFSGSIDNAITTWDLRTDKVAYQMKGHTDTVTSLRISPDGGYLLSNAMDNTLRLWDIKPFAPVYRCLKIFEGAPHGIDNTLMGCAWNKDGTQVAAGAGDRTVLVWDVNTRRIVYKLPGHNGCVNDVDFHPKEPILLSASSDKTLFLGELAQ